MITAMTYRVLLAAALASALLPGGARAEEPGGWVAAPKRASLNGESGKVWFSPVFSRKQGTFNAMYDSVLDARDSVSGDFLVARFRYTYDAPIAGDGKSSARHDESITTVLLDCDAHFSGTLSTRYLLAGKEVRMDDNLRNGDVMMTQMPNDAGTTVGDLCQFARQRGQK